MSYPDRAALLTGARSRGSPAQQGFGPGGINVYQQQQIQSALYQQQQIEFAQQQAQLEMHLQLEQMRLQNLALQEQIMIGQVHAQQQAQAQAQAEQQQLLHNTFYTTSKAPASNRLNFSQGQGGVLAERALARRQQQAEADALYAQYYPNGEEDEVVHEPATHPRFLASANRTRSQTPPSLVVSQPDEAFPVLAAAESAPGKISAKPKLTTQAHQHSDSGSSASTVGSVPANAKTADSSAPGSPAGGTEVVPTNPSAAVLPGKKKFSDVVKSAPAASSVKPSSAPVISVNTAAPKLNPFSSVFVPGSSSGSETDGGASAVSIGSAASKAVTFSEPAVGGAVGAAGVYRAPRAKSPPNSKPRAVSAPLTSIAPAAMGGMPTRQPRGPAAEAELTNQNFATRIRKRAIGAIKTLGVRPPNSPGPPTASASANSNYQYYHQQQMLEAMMAQQQQQQALAAAGYLDMDMGFHNGGMVSAGGIAHLMATARAREERFGY